MRGSMNFCQGGGVQARRPENSMNNVFLFFFSPQLILFYSLQRGPMVLLQRKLFFSQDPEGVQHLPGGGSNFFQRGGEVQVLISKETHITCDFQGGGGVGSNPLSPLWIRTWPRKMKYLRGIINLVKISI